MHALHAGMRARACVVRRASRCMYVGLLFDVVCGIKGRSDGCIEPLAGHGWGCHLLILVLIYSCCHCYYCCRRMFCVVVL